MLPDFDDEFAGVSDYARLYRQLGLQVVPAVHPHRNKNWKRPDLKGWKEFTNELVSDEQFNEWFGAGRCSPQTNLGILTGLCSGRVFIVDLDTHKNPDSQIWWDGIHADHTAGIMPDCPTQRTGGGGLQMLFRAPEGWTPPTIKTSLGVDIRGQGGFAVLAPSMHESGKPYEWLEDRGPSVLEIPLAEQYLCDEIDALAIKYGHTTIVDGERVKTESPEHETNEWGKLIDGREDRMYRMIFRCILDLYRDCPFIDPKTEAEAKMRCFNDYVDIVETRIKELGTPKHVLLEREGRGKSLFEQKWKSTMRGWETKISVEAQKPWDGKPEEIFKPVNYRPEEEKGNNEDKLLPKDQPELPPEGLFRVYRKSDLKALPPAEFIIEGLIQRYGSNYITGWPGCGKSFYIIGACIAISTGQDHFLGRKVNVHGPIVYVTTEGIHDHYTRMRAYEIEHGVVVDEERYIVIPDAMNLLESGDRIRLLKTIDWEIKRMKEPPVFVVFDTVSRVIPGADENNQKEMSLFVKSENEVQQIFNTTTGLAHHLSRAGNGNMRGSTVLEGSADTIIVLERESGAETGIIKAAKMKSAPDGWEMEFRLVDTEVEGFKSSLAITEAHKKAPNVPFGGQQETGYIFAAAVKMTLDERDQILKAANEAWNVGDPWSLAAQTKYTMRYAPRGIAKVLKKRIKSDSHALLVASAFVDMGLWSVEIRDKDKKIKGLKVSNMYHNGTDNLRKSAESQNTDFRENEE
jgi:KaiC/GvpD/RAD55 family RecA-like ATPase